MADFITVLPGPLSPLTKSNEKIPGIPASSNTTVNLLEVTLRDAPVGRDAIFEAFRDAISMGTVTVTAGTTTGSTAISTTVSAAQVVTWTVNQVGLGPGNDVGATATLIVREA